MLKITLHVENSIAIPINYKYRLCSYIYNLLKEGDSQLSSDIHNRTPSIKPFVFSDLMFKEDTSLTGAFKILSGYGLWYFASTNKECLEIIKRKIKKGIVFKRGKSESIIKVVKVEEINPDITDTVEFETVSPIIIYSKQGYGLKPINPSSDKYLKKIKSNLCKKHKMLYGEKIDIDSFSVEFIPNGKKIIENFKGNLLFGHYGKLIVDGPESIKRTVIECGVGQQTSGGFGFCIPTEDMQELILNQCVSF